ncbi:PRKC apoptosis WT1 regulator protein isoform X2 [Lampris incognitus]|nr:PRKC apoptosis WT1 regulator protein isoform X2 [Lampris incognitus]
MATGGFKSTAATDFLEEWKAKREKMRAKMLGDIAAATGAVTGSASSSSSSPAAATAAASLANPGKGETRNAAPSAEHHHQQHHHHNNNNGNASERGGPAVNCVSSSSSSSSSCAVARSASSSALRRPEEEAHPTPATPGNHPKKAPPPPTEKVPCASPESSPIACNESDKESPSPSKGKEKKSTGPSARKGKGQIEKRKLREKRRSTGVVSIPSNESLDELDDDDGAEKERKKEQQLVQANTFQNEAMTADPGTGHVMQETPRSGSGRHKSSAGPGSEEDAGGNSRHRHARHGRDGSTTAPGSLERRMEDMEKELARERQENARLLKAHQDKDDLIGKLKEEIDLLNRDLDDIEDENEQLKQENKTLLKVVGQLTR